nr:CHAT domain-containing tetratricopeptide repeat protein [Catenibacterium mitsuokai]
MNIFTIDSLIKQAEEAHNEKDYVKEKNAYQELYDLYKHELGELKDVDNYYRYLKVYNEALELYEEDYVAYKEILRELRENHFPTLFAVSDLVNLYSDYNRTIQLLSTLYDACKIILGENHPATLSVLNDLANSYSGLGDYNTALEMKNAVYNGRKKILGENHPDTLSSLLSLANSYSDLGDYNKACELQNLVYNVFKEILGKNHPDTLSALNNLGNSYFYLGDYNSALEIRNAVYNTRKENLDEDDPDTLRALANLANTYSCLGDYNKAFELQNTVYNIQKEILGENDLDTLLSLNNLAIFYSYLGDYNRALEVENRAYNALKENLGESHPDALLALSNLLFSQIYQDKTDNESIKNHMTAYFENANNLKTTAFRIKEISSRRNFLKSFNAVYELLKTSVFERNIKDLLDYLFINKNLSFEIDVNRSHNESMDERLSLEEVSHEIGNNLIIDFYELDDSKYGLILIKKGKYSQCVVDCEEIISGTFVNDEDIQLFIGSIRDYDHIYICPDGKLYNLSFERVLNCLNISYLSSVQTLFDNDTDDGNTDQLVSFIYPDFSGTQSEDNDRGDTKGVLYGSYLEGMFIHDIYGEKSTVYSSYQANHDNFFNTKRPRVLHVSTHGDYLDNENMEPMDRGILCLSGYNVEDNNYGYISAKEIQYMDLKGTELVVLSACNTGLGENISGEGIYGIRRAFELAGCQTLLLTVEEVDDFNSAIFMKSFYERYNQTNNIYQSFKDTKEYLKEHGLVELKEFRDVFEKEMKNKIKNPFIYKRNLNELNKRIDESEIIGQIVRKKNNQYIQEDWNGFIIQGKIENA